MAAPIDKPSNTAAKGRPSKPIWARTSVLCNGQIVWKVGRDQDMHHRPTDPHKAELKHIGDVSDDLNALNGLQIQRAKALTPLELKQPLRHVQSSLPKGVKSRIYTGDLFGSAGGVFSCPDDKFETKAKSIFGNEVRASGELNFNDFFRRLRRSEWLLWDVEAEKGQWVAVIAHLYKKDIRNPNKKHFPTNSAIPSTVPSEDFNRVDEWCVVSPQYSPEGDAAVERVKQRLAVVLQEGKVRIDKRSEIEPGIWIPTDGKKWTSGLRVYALIKALMHRITQLYCRQMDHEQSFWDPLPGWLNVDEVRAEMQGRAAQRCLAATGYRSRIAIEGVRRWIGTKEVTQAKELRPRRRDNEVYYTGKVGQDGQCVPIGSPKSETDSLFDDGSFITKKSVFKGHPGAAIGPPPKHVDGWNSADDTSDDDLPVPYALPKAKVAQLKELGLKLTIKDAVNDSKKTDPIKPPKVNGTASKPNTQGVTQKAQANQAPAATGKKNKGKGGKELKRKADDMVDIKADVKNAGGVAALLKKRLEEIAHKKAKKAKKAKKSLPGPAGQSV
ncbi:hypothetical protein E0Z10_g8722 [Xylaria hypoxylon]|uniref:Uncharacterized protein n=1 Tax=Xylaria hypoxylon TaxID=37992 RepID=A0A4Z0YUA3_9PEZI|nr:hypothetical protein E0Z10_g8722 [Xylaria hypoxylon]